MKETFGARSTEVPEKGWGGGKWVFQLKEAEGGGSGAKEGHFLLTWRNGGLFTPFGPLAYIKIMKMGIHGAF